MYAMRICLWVLGACFVEFVRLRVHVDVTIVLIIGLLPTRIIVCHCVGVGDALRIFPGVTRLTVDRRQNYWRRVYAIRTVWTISGMNKCISEFLVTGLLQWCEAFLLDLIWFGVKSN